MSLNSTDLRLLLHMLRSRRGMRIIDPNPTRRSGLDHSKTGVLASARIAWRMDKDKHQYSNS